MKLPSLLASCSEMEGLLKLAAAAKLQPTESSANIFSHFFEAYLISAPGTGSRPISITEVLAIYEAYY